MGLFLKDILAAKAAQCLEWLPGEIVGAPQLEVFQKGLSSHLIGVLWKEFLHRVRERKLLSTPRLCPLPEYKGPLPGPEARPAAETAWELFAFIEDGAGREGSENHGANFSLPRTTGY